MSVYTLFFLSFIYYLYFIYLLINYFYFILYDYFFVFYLFYYILWFYSFYLFYFILSYFDFSVLFYSIFKSICLFLFYCLFFAVVNFAALVEALVDKCRLTVQIYFLGLHKNDWSCLFYIFQLLSKAYSELCAIRRNKSSVMRTCKHRLIYIYRLECKSRAGLIGVGEWVSGFEPVLLSYI